MNWQSQAAAMCEHYTPPRPQLLMMLSLETKRNIMKLVGQAARYRKLQGNCFSADVLKETELRDVNEAKRS